MLVGIYTQTRHRLLGGPAPTGGESTVSIVLNHVASAPEPVLPVPHRCCLLLHHSKHREDLLAATTAATPRGA